MSNLTQLDACAASLARVYAQQGEFAILIRTNGEGPVRLIYPRTDVPRLAEFLHKAADELFDGTHVAALKPIA